MRFWVRVCEVVCVGGVGVWVGVRVSLCVCVCVIGVCGGGGDTPSPPLTTGVPRSEENATPLGPP